MSIISKVIKTVFGDKSAKDRKLIWPIVEQINEFQDKLDSLSDEHLIKKYSDLKIELSELIKTKKNELESSGIEDVVIEARQYRSAGSHRELIVHNMPHIERVHAN